MTVVTQELNTPSSVDLMLDLNNFDLSHLNQTTTIASASNCSKCNPIG